LSNIVVESQDCILNDLEVSDRSALAYKWTITFSCSAPRHIQSNLMRSALAWHCQMSQNSRSGNSEAKKITRSLQRNLASQASHSKLSAGTRLLREWQGVTHHVTVHAEGFEYNGKSYRSLTGIARLITGTAWSGPLFFGLRS
jgi:hypothetical protein